MTFVNFQLKLPKTDTSSAAYRHCSKCDKPQPPKGGIEMSPGKWICASCWTRRVFTNRKKAAS